MKKKKDKVNECKLCVQMVAMLLLLNEVWSNGEVGHLYPISQYELLRQSLMIISLQQWKFL